MEAKQKATPKKVCARLDGLLALKPERIVRAAECGVTILAFGDKAPEDAILLVDCRPKKFKGTRTASDPADTAIILGSGPFSGKHIAQFADFERALKKATALAADFVSGQ